MKITCVDEQVAATLQRGYYEIPRFQRPFAWDPENIDDFLAELFAPIGLPFRLYCGGIAAVFGGHFIYVCASRPAAGLCRESGCQMREIRALIEKLREKRPSRELFIAGFQDLRASELHYQQKRLVAYILRRFHSVKMGFTPSPGIMTIEHIANQGKAKDPDLVAMIGNLLYVTLDLNKGLGSKTFVDKRRILDGAEGVWADDFVLGGDKWGADEIEERTVNLAEQAYDTLWAF